MHFEAPTRMGSLHTLHDAMRGSFARARWLLRVGGFVIPGRLLLRNQIGHLNPTASYSPQRDSRRGGAAIIAPLVELGRTGNW